MSTKICSSCNGERLGEVARNVFINSYNLPQLSNLPINELDVVLSTLDLQGNKKQIATPILSEIHKRLTFLLNVGLEYYLTLSRQADTLSGGESQRIRLASQIGAGLVGVMYILDEPSIGLHARDNAKLISTLQSLSSMGNSVIVVEHDDETMHAADYIIDIGPGAGVHGGNIIAHGTIKDIINNSKSLTGQYLSGKKKIAIPNERLSTDKVNWLHLRGASGNNLQEVDLSIPLGLITYISGVSGSGKIHFN